MPLHKLSPLFVLLLAACGGGGGDNGTPASESRVLLERVAGPAGDRPGAATDPARGCVDGPASDILLGGGDALAIAANGQTKARRDK